MRYHRGMARARARGITLIELMVVAAIASVLALLAYVAYGRYIRTSRITEGTNMVLGICNAQESYKNSTGSYLDVSASLKPGDLYPEKDPKNRKKTPWGDGKCSYCLKDWRVLDVKSDGPVWYGYATKAGSEAEDPSTKAPVTLSTGVVDYKALNKGPIDKPWYAVVGMADADGNGKYATIFGSSFNSQVVTDLEGE